MKVVKILIGILLLFISIGIAVVTTNVIVIMSTPINQNPDDFKVYFSDVEVDGTQDLSLVESENKLVFNGEFSTVGDKKVISYDVTNASQNYDAEILIDCTKSTTYLNITNVFDIKNVLSARSTRTGTLTIELSTAVIDEVSQDVTCTIIANAVERESIGAGNVSDALKPYPYIVGKEIAIGEEKFNIISSDNTTVTMLAQFNLDTGYRQSQTANSVTFSNGPGWEYTPGPKDIPLQSYVGNAQTYINEYVSFLQIETGDSTLEGNLITLRQLKKLYCTAQDDYTLIGNENCDNSKYKTWLVNGQTWWTRSASTKINFAIFKVNTTGGMLVEGFYSKSGIRPVITISKSALEQYVL